MTHCPRVLGCLIALAAAITLPLPAARPAEAPKRSPFEGIAALEKPVTITETKIPVAELVQKVAAATGVSLTARREVADEPVALAVKEMPARELLEELADFLDYTWFREKPRDGEKPSFALWQDVAAKQREEALRQAGPAAAWQNLRAEVDRLVVMARLPQAQIQSIRDAGQRRLEEVYRQPREQRVAVTSTPEWKKLSQDVRAAHAVASPIQRGVAGFLGRLSEGQWATLRRERRLVFSSRPQAGALPLPEYAVRLFRATPPPEAQAFTPQGRLEDVAQFRAEEKARQANWTAASGYRVKIVLDDGSVNASGSLFLRAEVTPLLGDEPADHFGGGPMVGLRLIGAAEDFDERQAETTPARLAEWAKDPVFGRAERFQPRAKPEPDRYGPGSGGFWYVRNLLPDLARAYGVPFIADAYWSTGTVHGVQFPAEATPLYRILDLVGSAHRWDRRGNVVRLRSRAWFMERPREVPLRLVRRWAAIGEQHGALPLEEYVSMAAELSDLQLQGVGDLAPQGVLPRGLEDLRDAYSARHALRLYAALTPAQRDALWAGRPLSLAQTSGPPRQRFLAALQGIESDRANPELDVVPGLAPWSDPRFAIRRLRVTRIGEENGGIVHNSQVETGPPPPLAEPGAAPSPSLGPAPARPAARRSAVADLRPHERQAYTQVQFDFADADQSRASMTVTVAVSQ